MARMIEPNFPTGIGKVQATSQPEKPVDDTTLEKILGRKQHLTCASYMMHSEENPFPQDLAQ